MSDVSTQFSKLKEDLSVVGNDVAVLSTVVAQRAKAKIADARPALANAIHDLPVMSKKVAGDVAASTGAFVKKNPIASAGVAAIAGAVTAILLRKK